MSAAVASAKLSKVAQINPSLNAPLQHDAPVSFVPMAAVSAETAQVESSTERPYSEVSRGYTAFLSGDILVAKITPCFENGKIAQAFLPHSHGFGSTEFHVVRPLPEVSDGRYLHHFLRLDRVRTEGQRRMTGSAGQRRVPSNYLAELVVPLPPLPEQRRIAAILDQAETLRTQRRAALAELDSLTQSIFLDMFGDSRANPKAWQTQGIETACELIVDCVNRTAPVVEEVTPYKMIRTTNVKAGKVNLSSVRCVTLATFKIWNRRATPKRGDVLLTREAPLGEAGILDSDDNVFLGQRLMLYRPDQRRMTSEYLLHSFLSPFLQDQFDRHGSGSTVKHLPLPACRAFELRVPPLPLQQTFATRIQAIEALKAAHRAALAELDALFAALQQRAFAGLL